ncbi:MAG: TAT-variant-translocated molybdopterin oxidoreductase, partial [Rhodothermales bacterium]|nr:TAT-variant-translocated molybdopterin oxidoreductase [Rhodothermales bacterium]
MIELPVLDAAAGQDDAPRARFWRSVADLRNTDEFRELAREEFLPGASNAPAGSSRRQFLQIMGASMALAGLSACRKPVETIVPFVRRPEDVLPGVPVEYATAMMLDGILRPVVVESTDGRPTKIEGNADHPDSQGSSGVFEQASLLGLYDPDRSEFVRRDGEQSTWEQFRSFATGLSTGSRVAVIAPSSSSPTFRRLRTALSGRFATVRWVTYDARGNNVARGMQAAYGAGYRPRYRFSQAEVIVSLDADFLGPNDVNTVGNTREFAESRRVDEPTDTMSRLYVVESNYSITGGMADNRLRLKSSDVPVFATALAAKLGLTNASTPLDDHPWVAALASDLRSAGPNAVVLAGDHQPAEVHELCAAVNSSLGAVGRTVDLLQADEDTSDQSAELVSLAAELEAGEYDTLLVLGANPVYDAPAGLDMASAVDAVEHSIHVGLYVDETASVATWHVPATHYLEHWSDGRSHSGVLSVVQPLIAPLYEAAHSDLEVLALLATGREQFGYDLVRATWRDRLTGGTFDSAWRRVLHDGFLPDSAYSTATPSFAGSVEAASATELSGAEFEIVVSLDPTVHDGQFANNAWLQELPAPTTKIVWDNVAAMSPATAAALGIRNRLLKGAYYVDHVAVEVDGRSIEVPAWIQPGIADNSIQLTTGYGRRIASTRALRETNLFDLDDYTDIYGSGAVANELGVNVNPVRAGGQSVVSGASVTRVASDYLIASTQDHGAIEEEANVVAKRGLFRMATIDEYRANPYFVKDEEPAPIREDWSDYPTLWQENHPTGEDAYKDSAYNQNQWGMVI